MSTEALTGTARAVLGGVLLSFATRTARSYLCIAASQR
jgi:hypothetical protein